METPFDSTSRPEVFLPLLSACEPLIRAYVRSQVPTRDDMEEIMQEVSLALWKKVRSRDADRGVSSVGTLRGRKRSLYDGGVRVPFLVR